MAKRKNESETTEEVNFPRGGASVLTPLEHREISNKAAKDLFTAKKSATDKTAKSKENAKKKRKLSNKKDKSSKTTTTKNTVKRKKVEELTFKKFSVGSLVLGSIIQINELNIVVGLPNQLVGVVPITEVSDQLSTLVEAAAEDEDDEIELPNNKDIFYIGQWVQCRVTGVEGDDGSSKKKIDLSMKPSTVNGSIAKMDVTSGVLLSASVESVEDHGYVLSLGIEGLTGFCHHNDAKSYIETYNRGEQLIVGQYVQCLVKDMTKNKRTVNLTLDREVIATTKAEAPFSKINSITPGQLVNGLVQHSSSRGLSIKLMGLYDATIDIAQIPFTTDIESTYAVGSNLTFRTLFIDTTTENKQLYGSVISHCRKLGNLELNKKSSGAYIGELYPYGKFIEKVTVVRTTHAGVFVSLEKVDNIMGFIHISRLSDERVASIHAHSGPFAIGTTHRARVLSYSPVDGVLSLTIQPSILKEQYLQYSNIVTGKMVNGTIIKFAKNGVLVKLSDRINGYIPLHHLSDAKLTRPELKFKAGDKVRARVLLVDEEQRKVVLTLKKTLIESDLPIIKSVEDAKPKTATHGIIVSVQPKGSVIGFYNNTTGFCPGSEMTEESKNVKLTDAFHVGQTVKVYVLEADTETKKIMLSMIRDQPLTDAQREAKKLNKKNQTSSTSIDKKKAEYSIGDIVEDVKVTKAKPMQLNITLPNGAIGRIHITEVFDDYDSIPAEHRRHASYHIKDRSVKVKILGTRDIKQYSYLPISGTKNTKEGIECSLKLDKDASSVDIKNIHPGDRLLAFVSEINADNLKVSITPFIRGIVRKQHTFSNASKATHFMKHFSVGQAILASVISVDESKKSLVLYIVHEQEKDTTINVPTDIKSVKVGQEVNGIIRKVDAKTGLLVQLVPGVTGKVTLTELSDDFQSEPTKNFKENQVVKCKVLHVDYEKRHLDLSLRKSDFDSSITTTTNEEGKEEKRIIKSHNDIQKDDVIKGYVQHISSVGLFLAYSRNVHSRVKIAQLSDDFVKDWQSLYTVGQLVESKILSVDPERKLIEASLKKSAVLGIEPPQKKKKKTEVTEEQIPDYDESEDEPMEQDDDDASSDEEDEEEEDENMDENDDQDSDVDMVDANKVKDSDEESDEEEEDDDDSEEEKEVENLPALTVGGKFDWSGQTSNLKMDESDDSDEESEDDDDNKKKKTNNKKKQLIEDKTAELDSEAPQSISDFERLLVGSPDSSYLWINYMAYQLQLSEIDKARAIGERALKTINFREEQEKMNVWVALMNLENQFGSDESLEQLFKRSLTFCDPKKVYLQLVKIYERSEKLDKAELLWKDALKKFSQSSEIWTSFGEFYLKQGNVEGARELLQRSLKSLPKDKHIKTIVKFAQLEFKLGEAERGRTILEGVMSNSPKRVDLWNIYLDLEIKAGDHDMVQRLFERVVSMKFSSKKMKFLFKKWLQYEKDHGSADDVEHVKEKTLAYVSSL